MRNVRALLARDVAAEERRVAELARELQLERKDVQDMTTGVMGFLNELIAHGRLAEEQRQVVEAQARLVEAQGSLDQLRHQLAETDRKLAQLTAKDLDLELASARAAKEELLLRSGTSVAAELQDLGIRIESIDIELVPLVDAVQTGKVAFDALAQILATFDRAPTIEIKHAKSLAGDAQAKLVGFHRALSDVATASFADPLEVSPRDLAFADAWIRDLTAKGSPQERRAAARADMVARIERLGALLGPLKARHDDLANRRAQLVADRQKLIF